MNRIHTIEAGNRKVVINQSFDDSFTVNYYINNTMVLKSHHVTLDLAENVANDFIAEGQSPNQQLLIE